MLPDNAGRRWKSPDVNQLIVKSVGSVINLAKCQMWPDVTGRHQISPDIARRRRMSSDIAWCKLADCLKSELKARQVFLMAFKVWTCLSLVLECYYSFLVKFHLKLIKFKKWPILHVWPLLKIDKKAISSNFSAAILFVARVLG